MVTFPCTPTVGVQGGVTKQVLVIEAAFWIQKLGAIPLFSYINTDRNHKKTVLRNCHTTGRRFYACGNVNMDSPYHLQNGGISTAHVHHACTTSKCGTILAPKLIATVYGNAAPDHGATDTMGDLYRLYAMAATLWA